MKDPKISKTRVAIKRLKNVFKKKPKPLTLSKMLTFINKEYHFTQYDESLISEIYTKLMPYGTLKVINKGQYKYTIEIIDNKNLVDSYDVTQTGITKTEVE